MSLTNDIIKAIGKRQVLRNHTPVIPNISTIYSWEIDLFSVNPAGYTYEFEVKISRSDFLADKNKKKWTQMKGAANDRIPNYMVYVCPDGMIKENEVPEYAGLYYFKDGEIIEVKEPKQRHKEKKNINDINFKCARLLCQRYFLNGFSLQTHLNAEIKQRNVKRMEQIKNNTLLLHEYAAKIRETQVNK